MPIHVQCIIKTNLYRAQYSVIVYYESDVFCLLCTKRVLSLTRYNVSPDTAYWVLASLHLLQQVLPECLAMHAALAITALAITRERTYQQSGCEIECTVPTLR